MNQPQANLQDVPGAELLQEGGKEGTGNLLLLFREHSPPAVLKLYRFRRGRFREKARSFSQRVFEKKRGSSARARFDTERLTLDLWQREGFAVPGILNDALPPGIQDPALWMEYIEAPTLQSLLYDARRTPEDKMNDIHRLGKELARRHHRAFEIKEPLLIQEHATFKHILVGKENLVTVDLENGFVPGMPIHEAVAQELAGYIRNLVKSVEVKAEDFLNVFITGYDDRELLIDVARYAVFDKGLFRKLKRWHDRNYRAKVPKTEIMNRFLRILDR